MTRTATVGPELYGAIVDAFRSGLPAAQVAAAVGLGRSGLYNLLDRDERDGGDLRARVKAAQAAARDDRKRAQHGTESCYTNDGCRRPECRAAASIARDRRRNPATVLPLPAPERRPTIYEIAGPPPRRLADTA